MSSLAQPVSPSSFCAFCVQERLPNVEFYKQVAGCSPEQRQCFQLILGYDFRLDNFAVCRPCWKLMELLQDFRLRCLKANNLMERISKGILRARRESDDPTDLLAKIESFRVVIQHQLKQIERLESSAEESKVNSAGVVESTVEIDEIKIEPIEISDESNEPNMEYETTLSNNSSMEIEFGEKSNSSWNELSMDSSTKPTLDVVKQNLLTCDETLELFECSLCKATFIDQNELKTHQTQHAKEKPTYKCRKKCTNLFSSEYNRWRHELTCETKSKRPCTLCEKQLDNSQRLYEHYRLAHPDELKHPCAKCDKIFFKKEQLRFHERRFHFEGPTEVPCPKCGTIFSEAKDLMQHIKAQHHSGDRPVPSKQGGERPREKASRTAENENVKLAVETAVQAKPTRKYVRKVNQRKEKKSTDAGDRQSSFKGFKLKSIKIITP